jgi:hypothetical protein
MANLPPSSEGSHGWSPEALALAAQAKVLSGNKLEQLVVRLQRNTGRPSEQCWRFVIQYGLKGRVANRRWADEEVDFVREEIVKRSVDEIAKKLGRTPQSVRSMCRGIASEYERFAATSSLWRVLQERCIYERTKFVSGSSRDGCKPPFRHTAEGVPTPSLPNR